MALASKLQEASVPPNLRRGTAKARCGTCVHYDGRGECIKYGWPVRPTEVCGSYEAKEKRS